MSPSANRTSRRHLPLGTGARLLAATLTAVILAGVSTRATTLAIIRTATEVIIAGDSLLIWYGGNLRPQITCKLDAQDDVIFGMAGLVVSP
jgi:hypothetical protein